MEEHVAWFKLNESISLCKIICLTSLVDDKEGRKPGHSTGTRSEIRPCCTPAQTWERVIPSGGHSASARKEIQRGSKKNYNSKFLEIL